MKLILGNVLKEEVKYDVNEIQTETEKISKKVELMIVIGKNKHAFSEILYNIAKDGCSNAMLVETMEDLYLNYIKRFKIVGVIAIQEMPKDLVKQIIKILENTETERYIYENSR